MKINHLPFFAIICILIFSGCDKIEPPFIEGCIDCCGDSNNNEPIKRILVEEFTGHKCSGCPNATRTLNELAEFYCDHIIIVACHAGPSVFTSPDDYGPLSTDFRTPEYDYIIEEFGGLSSLPKGFINRINNGAFLSSGQWGTEIQNLIFDLNGEKISPDLDIDINYELKSFENNEIEISISIDYFNQLPGNYNLAVLITESNIISGQKDGNETIEDYIHNHIYRSAVNGAWGEPIEANNTMEKNYSFTFNSSNNINWNSDWNNMGNCAIVAYVYDTQNNEIIQASEKEINLID